MSSNKSESKRRVIIVKSSHILLSLSISLKTLKFQNIRFEIRDVQNRVKIVKIRKKVEKSKSENDYILFKHIRYGGI